MFDFVGLKSVAEQGLAMLGIGGGLYLVGVARPDVEIGINIVSAIGGQKRVQGVNFGSTNAKRDIPMYAELYLQGRMNLDDLVSKRIALRDVNDGYAALKDGSLNACRRHFVLTVNPHIRRTRHMETITASDTIKTITTHYIDGAFVESHGREVMDIVNPTNGKVIGRVTLGGRGRYAARHRRSQERIRDFRTVNQRRAREDSTPAA